MARKDPADEESDVDTEHDRLLVRITEAADRLGLSRSTVYELIGAGELKVVRYGRAVRDGHGPRHGHRWRRLDGSGQQRGNQEQGRGLAGACRTYLDRIVWARSPGAGT